MNKDNYVHKSKAKELRWINKHDKYRVTELFILKKHYIISESEQKLNLNTGYLISTRHI